MRAHDHPVSTAHAAKNERVREHVLELIRSGLGPHDRLPTERELAEQFGVTRMTVRRALDRLELEERVYRVQGAGTFVAEPPITKTVLLTSFSEDMRSRGLIPASRILVAESVPAGARIGGHLGISPSDPVVHLERIRLADGLPMCLENVHLPAALVPGLLEEGLGDSLYELLEGHYRIHIQEAEQSIQSTVVDLREAELLGVPPFSPALLVERTSYDQRGRRVERAKSIYRADRYSFRIRVRRVSVDGGLRD
jgi:GntR family transcriptional regulator